MRCSAISIATRDSLRKTGRKLSHRSASAARILEQMRRGASLQVSFERGRAVYQLSSGLFVTADTAKAVIDNPNVIGVGDCLFGGVGTSQTFRLISPED